MSLLVLFQELSRSSGAASTSVVSQSTIRSKDSASKNSQAETSENQKMLQLVTQELVTCHQDLDTFGLHLGLSFSEIDRARNNNPTNIERAALRLACIWWDQAEGSTQGKQEVIVGIATVNRSRWYFDNKNYMVTPFSHFGQSVLFRFWCPWLICFTNQLSKSTSEGSCTMSFQQLMFPPYCQPRILLHHLLQAQEEPPPTILPAIYPQAQYHLHHLPPP